jgi:cytochrome P450
MDLLGVPRDDLDRVKVWSDDIALFIGTAQVAGNKYLRAEAGAKAMSGYFRTLVEARTNQPTGDMISQLVLARDDRDALSTDEIIGTAILLLFAGHETTTNLIGNGFLYSMKNRDQWARLVADPLLADSAVEEYCATTAIGRLWRVSPQPTPSSAARRSAKASGSSPS